MIGRSLGAHPGPRDVPGADPGPDAELLIVGGPAEADLANDDSYVELAKFAAALGVADRVIFIGKVEYTAMPALLRSADLVVSTCQYEPAGTTSLQAMACGTPSSLPRSAVT